MDKDKFNAILKQLMTWNKKMMRYDLNPQRPNQQLHDCDLCESKLRNPKWDSQLWKAGTDKERIKIDCRRCNRSKSIPFIRRNQ